MAYTGSRHRRSVPLKSQIAATQARPDENPSSVGVAADISFSPSTGVAAAGGATITATVKRAAGSIRKVEVGTGTATNVVVLSDTKFTFTAPAQTAGARDVVIYDGVGSVTKTGGLTYV